MNCLPAFRSLISLVIVLVTFASCKKNLQEITPSTDYIPYVSTYTGGAISQTSPIRIILAQELPVVELGTEIKGNPFVFTPSLKGKAYWVDNRTIEFVPENGALQPGQLYNARFSLGEFVDLSKELDHFEFSFRVIERNFTANLHAVDITAADPMSATVSGEIRLSDVTPREVVKAMLTASAGTKKNLPITLNGADDADRYGFTVSAIPREATDTELIVRIDGKPAGINRSAEEKTLVPATGNFRFLSAERIQTPENGIQVVFSDPLAGDQDLKGLIVVPELANYVFQTDHNQVKIFFEPTSQQTITLSVNEGIRSADGQKTKTTHAVSMSGQALKPQVKLLSTGSILPDSKNLIIPFQAVSLRAVDVSVVRIFEDNVLMFMQDNDLSSSNELRRSGRLVYRKMFRLDTDPTKNLNTWENYSLDLSGLIRQQPGAIYRVELSFRQEYSAYPCGGSESTVRLADIGSDWAEANTVEEGLDDSVWDVPNSWYNSYYEGVDWNTFDWSQTDNPCNASYYYGKSVYCNVLASNLGVIIKQNANNKLWATVTDILTTTPLSQIDLTVYNFQLQQIGTAKTDANGFAELTPSGVPFVVVAASADQKTYVKVAPGEENSVSRFDTGGKELQKGLKGFIYGERGVWRPGDTLHISFIMEDTEQRIPDTHPVAFELYNPRGQFYSKLISTRGVNGFYTFTVPTKTEDPTGLWNGYVKVGGSSFHKSFRIETVKPNRLKIDLKLPEDYLDATQKTIPVTLTSSWLTGATASNLKAKVEMSLAKTITEFPGYTTYIFNNPATEFTTSKQEMFDGVLNQNGVATFTMQVPESKNAPGLLRANITSRVFEQGGDASMMTTSVPFSPFPAYVGINLNQPEGQSIETDTEHVFDIVTVDAAGKPVNRSGLVYTVYRIDWSWWWENRNDNFGSYINNSSIKPEAEGELVTINGKAQFAFRVDYPSWGRYLVYVKDRDGGHATGGTVYFDWPESRGRSNKTDPSGITMLSFTVDKESYESGETVTVTLPAAAAGRALVTIENGTTVLKREWVQVNSKNDTKYQFKIAPEMAPNVYVHVSLLQPHAQTVNDLPIRMYGVVPVFVHDKESLLKPQIKMPEVLRPETAYTVSVSEASGKAMTYTLAVVDDGLLDLTNYKTPDPWAEFYAREALGIRTWDMFDKVIGAYTGSYSSLFSVGGDEMLRQPDAKANRFKPVVKFIGPYTLYKGKTNTHNITLPMYVGSVRTMVIAGQEGAYGNVEKTTPVRSPLMVLSTLPRVISTGEEIQLPVNVFAMEEQVKQANVTIEVEGGLHIQGTQSLMLDFESIGDKLATFKLKAGELTGKATIRIAATGNGQAAKETIEIEIRNPNPVVTQVESKLIQAKESTELSYHLEKNTEGSYARLEVSRLPSVDITRRFDFLYNYTHYCTEQITSTALPLLFLSRFKEINSEEDTKIKANVQEAIRSLYGRQLPNGSFVYWPGYPTTNEWITSYAGVFLTFAQEKGYEVNSNIRNKWISFQRRAAQNWSPLPREMQGYEQSDLQQAYRLYSLALAGSPEPGAMNRMKEMKELGIQAKWCLAAAYAVDGKTNAANELVFNASTEIKPYRSDNPTYGSSDRDEAMILETLVLLGNDQAAFAQAQKVSRNLARESYFSTQSTAFALVAMGRMAEKVSGAIEMELEINSKVEPKITSAKAIWQTDLPETSSAGKVKITNNGNGLLYADLITRTQLQRDNLPAINNNLRLTISYTDNNGRPANVHRMKQGTDFVARITISNTSGTNDYTDLALTHIVPSGWEIYNERMIQPEEADKTQDNSFTYRDIRDDRILTYFDLPRNQSKTFDIRLQAAYAGVFTLPAIQCEAMYDTHAMARTRAGLVTVER